MKFTNAEQYYSYMSQGHCCAPKFKELTVECRGMWVDEFARYKLDEDDDSKKLEVV